MARPKGIFEFLLDEVRWAARDIRQKVVEQGWFGQVATPKPVVEMHQQSMAPQPTQGDPQRDPSGRDPSSLERRPSFEEQWAPREHDPEQAEKERGHEIER